MITNVDVDRVVHHVSRNRQMSRYVSPSVCFCFLFFCRQKIKELPYKIKARAPVNMGRGLSWKSLAGFYKIVALLQWMMIVRIHFQNKYVQGFGSFVSTKNEIVAKNWQLVVVLRRESNVQIFKIVCMHYRFAVIIRHRAIEYILSPLQARSKLKHMNLH